MHVSNVHGYDTNTRAHRGYIVNKAMRLQGMKDVLRVIPSYREEITIKASTVRKSYLFFIRTFEERDQCLPLDPTHNHRSVMREGYECRYFQKYVQGLNNIIELVAFFRHRAQMGIATAEDGRVVRDNL